MLGVDDHDPFREVSPPPLAPTPLDDEGMGELVRVTLAGEVAVESEKAAVVVVFRRFFLPNTRSCTMASIIPAFPLQETRGGGGDEKTESGDTTATIRVPPSSPVVGSEDYYTALSSSSNDRWQYVQAGGRGTRDVLRYVCRADAPMLNMKGRGSLGYFGSGINGSTDMLH